ncbi:MAG: polysaccharide biosynthesis/export family protein [Comamonas sp.]
MPLGKPIRPPARPALLAVALAASTLAAGCSLLAPGYSDVRGTSAGPAASSDRWSSFSSKPEDTLVQITPEVIRTLDTLQPQQVPADIQALFGEPQPYTIGPGDVVGIVVYDHAELMPSSGAVISQTADPTGVSAAPGLIVNAAGEISYPYVGRVKVAGLTEVQATELLTRRLATYIQNPQVTLRIQSFRSQRAYVEGEVRTPGMQIFTDRPMTLPEAINRAGGIATTGDQSNIVLTRNGRSIPIDLPALRQQNVDVNRILLRNGDTLQVRSRDERKVYVMGEALRPSALQMRDGHLSLNQALGEAGGVNLSTANPGQIYVIRRQEDNTPAVFHLDAKNPAMLALADGFNLQPRDVVYIDPVGLVRWNRIVSLIVPSAAVLNYGSAIQARD